MYLLENYLGIRIAPSLLYVETNTAQEDIMKKTLFAILFTCFAFPLLSGFAHASNGKHQNTLIKKLKQLRSEFSQTDESSFAEFFHDKIARLGGSKTEAPISTKKMHGLLQRFDKAIGDAEGEMPSKQQVLKSIDRCISLLERGEAPTFEESNRVRPAGLLVGLQTMGPLLTLGLIIPRVIEELFGLGDEQGKFVAYVSGVVTVGIIVAIFLSPTL